MVITLNRLRAFLHRGPRHAMKRIYYAARAPQARCFPLVAERLTGRGLEIGGPSPIFARRGLVPVYPNVGELDNCNFGPETVWEGRLTEGRHFRFGERTGFLISGDQASGKVLSRKWVLGLSDPSMTALVVAQGGSGYAPGEIEASLKSVGTRMRWRSIMGGGWWMVDGEWWMVNGHLPLTIHHSPLTVLLAAETALAAGASPAPACRCRFDGRRI